MSHPNYNTQSASAIRVLADIGAAVSFKLVEKGASLTSPGVEEVLVLGTYKPSNSSLTLERLSTNVLDAIDVEQMERFGDSDVAAALTRVVGVSVSRGKYANVRGLDGRYISTSLNGILMPSTDPVRRDVQLDLFPSNMLEGIDIQKTYSSDLLGSTTGGNVKIRTKGIPSAVSYTHLTLPTTPYV